MSKSYTYPEFPYRQSAAQREGRLERHPLVVIGAGPIGLSIALDCAQRGIAVRLIDDNNTVSFGSRAVCYAKRPLEIWDRLGVAAPLVAKGVRWQVGKVFLEDEQVYQFDLLPERGHKMPAMINLQQYYVEQTLVDACEAHPKIDIGWKHKLVALAQQDDHARLTVETPDGRYHLEADWVIACDGANSDTRQMVGAQFTGQFFEDRFLIADVVLKSAPQPAHGAQRLGSEPERWFWFDPPFHRGQSVLLHKQCDDVWRIDFQLGRDADPEAEKRPERVIPRIQAMLGPELPFELEWVSVYQFACRRIDKFRYGRVIFAGDSAHQVSPFGARGANTGIQDVDNLAWKLKLVLDGQAPLALIDSYHEERAFAADDNLLNSTRATDFISPKSPVSLRYRNAVLELAATEPFARPLINSGRLSTPTPYLQSSLNTPDEDTFAGLMKPGTNCADAPLQRQGQPAWLLNVINTLHGPAGGFTLLCFGPRPAVESVAEGPLVARVLSVGDDVQDADGLLAQRYDAQPGTVYLIRPDQHVAARWRSLDAAKVRAALRRATAQH
ncbi:MAG: FAD-dependent oxidoreductase [Burkholderiales bacterium]|nr:FAD-dependent oxidoreductase [Burkholderiales bacterium]